MPNKELTLLPARLRVLRRLTVELAGDTSLSTSPSELLARDDVEDERDLTLRNEVRMPEGVRRAAREWKRELCILGCGVWLFWLFDWLSL